MEFLGSTALTNVLLVMVVLLLRLPDWGTGLQRFLIKQTAINKAVAARDKRGFGD